MLCKCPICNKKIYMTKGERAKQIIIRILMGIVFLILLQFALIGINSIAVFNKVLQYDITPVEKIKQYSDNVYYYGVSERWMNDTLSIIDKECLTMMGKIILSTKEDPTIRYKNIFSTKEGWETVGYNSKKNNITFVMVRSREKAQKTLFHEIGHTIYRELSQNQKEEYEKIYEDTLEFPSIYAKRTHTEDFCESFAMYNMQKIIPKDREIFIKNTLNGCKIWEK